MITLPDCDGAIEIRERMFVYTTTATSGNLDWFNRESFADSPRPTIPLDRLISRAKEESREVKRILDRWIITTSIHSSPTMILDSPLYLEAKKLRGAQLVHDLLSMIDVEPYHVVIALSDLEQPLPFVPAEAGDIRGLVDEWKEWARRDECATTDAEFSESTDNYLDADKSE